MTSLNPDNETNYYIPAVAEFMKYIKMINSLPADQIADALGPHLNQYRGRFNELERALKRWMTPIKNPITGLAASINENRNLWNLTAGFIRQSTEPPTDLFSLLNLGSVVPDAAERLARLTQLRVISVERINTLQNMALQSLRDNYHTYLTQNELQLESPQTVTTQTMNAKRTARLRDTLEKQSSKKTVIDISELLEAGNLTDDLISNMLQEQHGTTLLDIESVLTTLDVCDRNYIPKLEEPLDINNVTCILRNEIDRITNMLRFRSDLINLLTVSNTGPAQYKTYSRSEWEDRHNKFTISDSLECGAHFNAEKEVGYLINRNPLIERINLINYLLSSFVCNCCNCGEIQKLNSGGIYRCDAMRHNFCQDCAEKFLHNEYHITSASCPMCLYEHNLVAMG